MPVAHPAPAGIESPQGPGCGQSKATSVGTPKGDTAESSQDWGSGLWCTARDRQVGVPISALQLSSPVTLGQIPLPL